MYNNKNEKIYPVYRGIKEENNCNTVTPPLAMSLAVSHGKVYGIATATPRGKTVFHRDIDEAVKKLQKKYGPELDKVRVITHDPSYEELLYLYYDHELKPAHAGDTVFMNRILYSPESDEGLEDIARKHDLHYRDAFITNIDSEPTEEQFEKIGEAAKKKAETILGIAKQMLKKARGQELGIIDHTIRMAMSKGLQIDRRSIKDAILTIAHYEKRALEIAGVSKQSVTSDIIFTKLMGHRMDLTPFRMPWKEGKDGLIPAIASTDPEMQELCKNPIESIKTLAQARLIVGSTTQLIPRLQYLQDIAPNTGNFLPPMLQYHKSITGRFAGGGGFNIQNLPHPDRDGDQKIWETVYNLRKSIKAPKGKKLVSCDACQIEARILAWFCDQMNLNEAFANGDDIYSEFASEVFEEEVRKPADNSRMKALRKIGKQAILGLGYGMGVKRFLEELMKIPECKPLFDDGTLTQAVCAEIVYGFRGAFDKITDFWKKAEESFIEAYENGTSECLGLKYTRRGNTISISLPSGRSIIYPKVRITPLQKTEVSYIDYEGKDTTSERMTRQISYADGRSLYSGKLVENITQAIARDILVNAILRLEKDGREVVCHVHDDIVCCVSEKKAQECLEAMVEAWRSVPEWADGLILDAEGRIGTDFLTI